MAEAIQSDGLALSNGYAKTMADIILPAIEKRKETVELEGARGWPLYCARYRAETPRGTVVVTHGFTENEAKFAEAIHSLLQNGLSVVAWDQRGHGRSGRDAAVQGDPTLTHVDAFDDYVRDMETVMDRLLPGMPGPVLSFSHSMGGAVTALYMEAHPTAFARAAMCAPMIAPQLGMPNGVVLTLCALMRLLGRSKRRVFVSRPYVYPDPFETSCATGRERFDWYEDLRRDVPGYRNNSPTYAWTREAARVTGRILAPGAPEKIKTKVRLYTAQLDHMVQPGPQRAFVARVPGATQTTVAGAKHEIYRSDDAVLFPWWRDVLSFLKGEMES